MTFPHNATDPEKEQLRYRSFPYIIVILSNLFVDGRPNFRDGRLEMAQVDGHVDRHRRIDLVAGIEHELLQRLSGRLFDQREQIGARVTVQSRISADRRQIGINGQTRFSSILFVQI